MLLDINSLKESVIFLNHLYENVTSAIFLADHDARIYSFNDSFKSLFYKPEDEILMHLCGNVIGCIFQIEEKKDCGQTSHCCDCPLRNNIIKTLTEKVPVYKEKLIRNFYIKNIYIEKHFIFSTKYINYQGQEVIIVIVDDITEIDQNKNKLRLTNKKLLRKNKDLQQSLLKCLDEFSDITKNYEDEKMGLIKEVHHRVGNNLAVILALIKLQNEELNINNYMDCMANTENRILIIKKLHDIVFTSRYKETINIKNYINSICDDLMDLYNFTMSINITIDDLKFKIGISLIIGLIINEVCIMLSNYYKNSKKINTIDIQLNKNLLKFTFYNIGQKIKKNDLSLKLVAVLTQQLNGIFMITYNDNIEINIDFPA